GLAGGWRRAADGRRADRDRRQAGALGAGRAQYGRAAAARREGEAVGAARGSFPRCGGDDCCRCHRLGGWRQGGSAAGRSDVERSHGGPEGAWWVWRGVEWGEAWIGKRRGGKECRSRWSP